MLSQQVLLIGKRFISILKEKKKNCELLKFRCGALHCSDQINGIDDKSFNDISIIEANAIVQSCTSDFCRIEVTPASALASMNMIIDQSQNRGV